MRAFSKRHHPLKSSGEANRLFEQALHAQQIGRNEEAIELYRQVIAARPNDAAAHANLGVLLASKGQIDAAIKAYRESIAVTPSHVAYNNLAILYRGLSRLEESIDCYRKAIAIQPKIASIHYNLANALKSNGSNVESLAAYRRAVRLSPEDRLLWQEFATSVAGIPVALLDAGLMDDVSRCLSIEGINKDALSPACSLFLLQRPEIKELIDLNKAGKTDELITRIENGAIGKSISHPILVDLLKSIRLQSIELEKLLTGLRRLSLFLSVSGRITDEVKDNLFGWLSSLALQCYLNEYIYYQDSEETAWLNNFLQIMDHSSTAGKSVHGFDIAIIGAYIPLYKVESIDRLIASLSNTHRSACKQLIERQIEDRKREVAILPHIQSVTGIHDATSKIVQDQYEENPYPRWNDSQHIPAIGGLRENIYSLFPYLPEGNFLNPISPEILIAGCGTGKQAIECAKKYPHGRILAIDLSRASIAYAVRKAKELGVSNITFRQADILELGQMGQTFDLVASVGVLHHMQNPIEGWRTLTRCVKPGGYMQIGLYSKIARQHLNLLRENIRMRGLGSSCESIREFRRSLFAQGGKLLDQLSGIVDFFSTSECRDLLFHVQEHQFSLPELKGIIEDLSLAFLGFEVSPSVITRFKQQFPSSQSETDLGKWHEFELENSNTFAAMYQFWLCNER